MSTNDLQEIISYITGNELDVQYDLTAVVPIYAAIPTALRAISHPPGQIAQMEPPKYFAANLIDKLKIIVLNIGKHTMPAETYKSFEGKVKRFFEKQKLSMYDTGYFQRSSLIVLSIIAAQIIRIYSTDKETGKKMISLVESHYNSIKKLFKNINLKGGAGEELLDDSLNKIKQFVSQMEKQNDDSQLNTIREIRKLEQYQEIKEWMNKKSTSILDECDLGPERCLKTVIELSDIFHGLSCNTRIRMIINVSPEKIREILIKMGFQKDGHKFETVHHYLTHSSHAKIIRENPKLQEFLRLLIERINQEEVPLRGGTSGLLSQSSVAPLRGGYDEDKLYGLLKDLKRLENELGKKKFVIPINVPMSVYVPLNFRNNDATESSLLLHLINKLKKSLHENGLMLDSKTEKTLNDNMALYQKLEDEVAHKLMMLIERDRLSQIMGQPFYDGINEIQQLMEQKNKLGQTLIKNALCMVDACIKEKN